MRECPFPKLHLSRLIPGPEYFMSLAYNQAIEAWRQDEVPIGAVIVHHGEVIASAHNQVETMGDPTAHAEMLAITQAARALGDWRLAGADLYVTKEPCPMCAGACLLSRLQSVCYAVPDPKAGCLGGAFDTNQLPGLNHRLVLQSPVLVESCRDLLQAFFREKRLANDAGG